MKSLKKILSIFAAFMMVVGLTAANVKAASTTGTITVNNADSSATYTAYKILDAAIDEDNSVNTTYSIKSTSEWYDFVNNNDMFTLTAGSIEEGVTTYYVTANSVNAATLATQISAYLKSHSTITGTVLTYNSTSETATASNLALGYYFVSSTTGALCNLTTNNPNAQINDKNESHFEKTTTSRDVEIGDTVSYTINGIVPDTTGFETYTYKITDTMATGLTFNGPVTVKVNGTTLSEGDNTYKYTKVGNGFEVEIYVKNFSPNVSIEVTYDAIVNETAFQGKLDNDATLVRGPGEGEKKGTSTVTVFNSQISILKVDSANIAITLNGAKFVLKNENGKFYQLIPATDNTPITVNWVDSQDDATEVTTTDGAAKFSGLKNGTYQLIETKAPDGYNLKTDPTTITINNSNNSETFVFNQTIENGKGSQLPSTGGMGTTMIYIAGAILMVGAAIIFVTNKRMKHE